MKLTLKIWRQDGPQDTGALVTYNNVEASEDMSFLEMLDVLNQRLIEEKEKPVAFDHDCREGICGTCGMMINGIPHGPLHATTTCQLHMRHFRDGDTIVIEPFRANAFPVVKDLVVDRTSFDRIIESGGYISVNTGQAPDGNVIPIERDQASLAFDAAACIGCGACVAACPNASASLFTAAKVAHLARLPQGKVESHRRVQDMVSQMNKEGFGNCTFIGACEAECPKEISVANIAKMNKEYIKSSFSSKKM